MAGVAVLNEYGWWSADGHSTRIEYSLALLTQIDMAAIEGFNRFRRGGIEVGGVLFGVQKSGCISILAFRPFPCEYALGPKFAFTDKDHTALEDLLKGSQADEALAGMAAVGWYHSHTRSGVHLSTEDLEIFDRHFPDPWQVALVLRPDKLDATKAGFFFREADGSIHAEASYREFSLPSALTEAPAVSSEPDRPPATVKREPLAGSVLISPPAPVPLAPPVAPSRKWIAYAAVAILAVMSAWFARSRTQPRPSDELSLTLEDRGGQLRIAWDRTVPAIREAPAFLEISEGAGTARLELDGEQLRAGAVTYARETQNVVVRMKAGPAEETATFVAPAEDAGTTGERQLSPKSQIQNPKSTGGVDEATQSTLRQQAEQIKRLEETVESLRGQKQAAPKQSTTKQSTTRKPEKKPAPLRIALTRKAQPIDIPSLAPPPFEAPASPLTAASSLIGRLAPPPAISAAHARAGTLIWTGRLTRNGVITISGNRPSTGALTGEVPGFPVQVNAYPANLTADGLKVYTPVPKYSADYSEAPGPRNGWNRTSYLHDPKRAQAVTVLEQPAADNAWKRMVLRSDGSTLSIVMVEWRAIAK